MSSQDDVRAWVKSCLVPIGMFALLLALNQLRDLPTIPLELWRDGFRATELVTRLLGITGPFLLVVTGAILIQSRQSLAERISSPVEGDSAIREAAAYRLALMFAGVWVLSQAFFALGSLGAQLGTVLLDDHPRDLYLLIWDNVWVMLICNPIKLAIGGYLLFGAPRLVE